MKNKPINDILVLSQAASYDAILVGRRGASYLREWVMGSVTAGLVEHSEVLPIWVVDGDVKTDNIVLAADGSQASLRALDHMIFMLSAKTDRKIHVVHVRPQIPGCLPNRGGGGNGKRRRGDISGY